MRRALSAVLSAVLSVSLFPIEAAAQVVRVTVVSVPGAPAVLPTGSSQAGSAPSLNSGPNLSLSLSPLSSPNAVLTPAVSIIPSAVQPVAVKPSALKVAVVIPAASKQVAVTPAFASVPTETQAVQARALFDGASRLSAASTPDPVEPDASPAPAASDAPAASRRRLPRPFTSRLARWTGVAALYSVYRDGVLIQRFAARLGDHSVPPARRASAARLLASIGRVEAVPTLAQAQQNDPSPRVRRVALSALIALLEENAPRLIRTLKVRPGAGARQAAASSLGWLVRHSDAPEAVEALGVAATTDRAEDVRLTAISALAAAKSPKAHAALVWMRAQESRPHMRSALELALAESSRRHAGPALMAWSPRPDEFADAREPLHEVALKRSMAVAVVFVVVELIGAFVTGSVALKADAMHMIADQIISGAALFSIWMSRRPPNSRKSYGYLKVEAVVGLFGALMIAFMGFEMATEAWHRIFNAGEAATWTVALFALSSLAANAFSALILWRHHGDSLGVKGAFLHAATDAIGSLGVIVSVALALLLGWTWAEPVVVAMIVVMIAKTAWELGKPAWNVLIDAVPPGVSLDRIEADLLSVPDAAGVHDLHVWALNSRTTALTATVFVRPGADHDQALATAKALLVEKHGIKHMTVQIETIKPAR